MTYEEIMSMYVERWGDLVCEPPAYLLEKQQGEFTAEDYFNLPKGILAELIEGKLVPLNAPSDMHQKVAIKLVGLLDAFIMKNRGKCIPGIAPWAVQFADDLIVQPDVFAVCDKDKVKHNRIAGAPDFVIEILSPSNRKNDTERKYAIYRTYGVREYWMIDLERETITVCEFGEETKTTIYGLHAKVPVRIFEGKCVIDFAQMLIDIESYFA